MEAYLWIGGMCLLGLVVYLVQQPLFWIGLFSLGAIACLFTCLAFIIHFNILMAMVSFLGAAVLGGLCVWVREACL